MCVGHTTLEAIERALVLERETLVALLRYSILIEPSVMHTMEPEREDPRLR